MNKQLILAIFALLITSTHQLYAQQIIFSTNPETGAISSLKIAKDGRSMNWLVATDGTQYSSVTRKYGWGLGYFTETVNGIRTSRSWEIPVLNKNCGKQLSYRTGDLQVDVRRSLTGNDLIEEYIFTNRGKRTVSVSDLGIYTPFNDNYPNAETCITSRTHAHIWDGGNAAYINATQMGANAPHLGLILLEGAIDHYEIWDRDMQKSMSNTRGIIAMMMPEMTLKSGEKTSVKWRIFTHSGWADFHNKILEMGNIIAQCNQYTFQKGEKAYVEIQGNENLLKNCTVTKNGKPVPVSKLGERWVVETTMDEPGKVQFEINYGKGKRTHIDCMVFSNYESLIAKRANFIIDHQQLNNSSDPRDGAYMVYDNETDKIFMNTTGSVSPADRNEGAERLGMGAFLAKQYLVTKDQKIRESLMKYVKFVRSKLQDKDYTTWSSVKRDSRNRAYNYTWVAEFYFLMYKVSGDPQYATDGFKTMKSMYSNFGHGFYSIGTPVRLGLNVLKDAGMHDEYKSLLADYLKIGDTYIANGLFYPISEVNYEQSIVAPSIQLLCELYLETGVQKYLVEAKRQMPVLEAFAGFQPSYHMNEIGIRHWDGYWFGKYEFWGDTFPHYWSAITAAAYHYYYQCTQDKSYQQRAENIVRNNLSLFSEEGRGYCAYLYPQRVNGKKAGFYDPYANDQDWALGFYYLVNLEL
ncbi:hypothetical protein [Sphingobacterium spiritivorum]|nr:hypothetical protein [Sphingobacterium spiritivorum]QQS94825.1 six-hairpin glycosidase [Sphingobacterium spiritivorum]